MKRRALILGGVSGAGLIAIGAWRLAARERDAPASDGEAKTTDGLVARIAAACGGLEVEPGSIETFAEELRIAGRLAPAELDPVGRFLLSTDLFMRPPDAVTPVRYLGLYDPYRRPCLNPLVHGGASERSE